MLEKNTSSNSFFSDNPLIFGTPTLFDIIEQEDKKYSTFFNNYDEKEEKICTDFNSKSITNNRKIDSMIKTQDPTFHNINDLENNFSLNFENPLIFGSPENKADELTKLDNFIFNDNIKQKEKKLIGKKRNLNEKTNIKTKEEIFEEIKKLFDDYNHKYKKINEIIPSYKIFEQSHGSSRKCATIVEKKIPGCVIYFQKNVITNIYLIREGKFLEEENKILKLLNIIKSNFKFS